MVEAFKSVTLRVWEWLLDLSLLISMAVESAEASVEIDWNVCIMISRLQCCPSFRCFINLTTSSNGFPRTGTPSTDTILSPGALKGGEELASDGKPSPPLA